MRLSPALGFIAFVGLGCSSEDTLQRVVDAGAGDGGSSVDGGGFEEPDAGPCEVSNARAARACQNGNVHWFDNCGSATEQIEACASGCSAGQCISAPWFGFGPSEPGPYTEHTTWGSASGWGVSGSNSYSAYTPSVAIDPTTRAPLVAFSHANGQSTRVRVVRYDGEAFEQLEPGPSGDFPPAGQSAGQPKLVVRSDGTPLVAWTGRTADQRFEVFYSQYDGTAWSGLGGSDVGAGISNEAADSVSADLALDDQERPIIVWQSSPPSGNGGELRAKRWDGSSWVGLGGSDTNGAWAGANDSVHGPSIATDSSGQPYVAFCETSTGAQARRWNGSTWAPLGASGSVPSIGPSEGQCLQTAIVVDEDDRPVVAWLASGNVFLRRWTGSEWEELDHSASDLGVSGTDNGTYEMSLSLIDGRDPVLGWRAPTPGGVVNDFSAFLKRWNGSAWVAVGDSATGHGLSDDPRATVEPTIAAGTSDEIYVAWRVEAEYPSRTSIIHLRKWNGSDWVELGNPPPNRGGISGTARGSRGQRVLLDSNKNPTVTWFDQTDPEGFPQILLRRWDGRDWVELAGSGTGRGLSNLPQTAYYPSLVLERDTEYPIVAWSAGYEPSQNDEIYLKRWNGSAWEELADSATAGGISKTETRSVVANLRIDAAGKPIVSWLDETGEGHFPYLRRFDGQSWMELGGSASGMGVSTSEVGVPALAMTSSGDPVLGWTSERRRFVFRRWDGGAWVPFADGGFEGGEEEAYGFDFAIGPNDEVAVTWSKAVGPDNYEVRLRFWDGTLWRSLAGSSSGGGISDNPGRSVEPNVVFDDAGRPMVTWRDDTTGNDEILLARWDGFRWEGVLGSNSGGGLSNSANDCEGPDITYRDNRLCVSWGELDAISQQVLLRCVDFAP